MTEMDNGQQETAPRSVLRLLGLFETVAAAPEGLSLAELSVTLAVPKSSLLMLIRPLAAHGYLNHALGRYRLGPKMFQLASDIVAARRFPNVLRPFMEELVARTAETVLLMVCDPEARTATFIEVIDGPQVVRYNVRPGTRLPLYCAAGGRVFLTYADKAWRDDYLKSVKTRPITPRTIWEKAAVRRELEKVRETGLSVAIGETALEATGVGAPVFDSDGKVAAALVVGVPTERFERVRPMLERHLADIAAAASAVMGYRK